MFDVAYIAEANIYVADKLKQKTWDKILNLKKLTFSNTIPLMFDLERYTNILKYWSIYYGTHGN